jgi:DNA-binding CsgD family transcriptional regulator
MKGSPSKQRAGESSERQAPATKRQAVSTAARKTSDLSARILEPRFQKSLLRLHVATETDEVIDAVYNLMDAAVPSRYIGIWFQLLEFSYPRILRIIPPFPMSPEQWKRSFEITPAVPYFAANPGVKLWRNRDAWTDEAWRAMDFYREFAQPMGFHYTVNLGIWKGNRLVGGTSGMRSLEQGDYTEVEMQLLRWLHPYLDATIKRLDRLHGERNARVAVEQLLRRLPLPTLLLDWDLRVIHANPSAKESCAQWNGDPQRGLVTKSPNGSRVPEPLVAICRELRAKWNDEMAERYSVASAAGQTVAHPANSELRANIHLVQRSAGSIAKPIFRIEFQPLLSSEDAGGNRDLALAARLTRRERELVELLCQGAANKEIANRLSLSLGTVKKELNTLYHKLDVKSRSQLMALMR